MGLAGTLLAVQAAITLRAHPEVFLPIVLVSPSGRIFFGLVAEISVLVFTFCDALGESRGAVFHVARVYLLPEPCVVASTRFL